MEQTRHYENRPARLNFMQRISWAAVFSFFGLLTGVVVSGFGAQMGTDSKDDYNRYDRPVDDVK